MTGVGGRAMIVRVVWECLSEEVAFELKNYKNQPCKDLGGESILAKGRAFPKVLWKWE